MTARRILRRCGWLARILAVGLLLFIVLYRQAALPLLVRDPLTRADCILVLGGGVDEYGRPTSSTAERVWYGVGLYREGFADRLLFSTGAPGGSSESKTMERLAIAWGIPPAAILVEDSSRNTRENLLFCHRIFQEQGWQRVILVSSPYHMRRVALIARECRPGISLLYAPVHPSEFDHPHGAGHRLRQALAVLHEYGGLAWYWLRGYIRW